MLSRVCFTNTRVIAFGHTNPAPTPAPLADDQVSIRREKKEENNPDILHVMAAGWLPAVTLLVVVKLISVLYGKHHSNTHPNHSPVTHSVPDISRRR